MYRVLFVVGRMLMTIVMIKKKKKKGKTRDPTPHFPVLGIVSDPHSGLWVEEAGSHGCWSLGELKAGWELRERRWSH